MLEFKRICHVYDTDGRLHADHRGERGITEADIETVLTSLAYVEWDKENPDKFYAAGATRGLNPYLLVVCLEISENEIFALTAWPLERNSRWRKAYLKGSKGGRLWVPAQNITGS